MAIDHGPQIPVEAESEMSPVFEWMRSMGPQMGCGEEISMTGAMMCSIMMLNSVIERMGNRILETYELTMPQWLALGCITNSGEEGTPHGHIGQKLLLSKAPVTGVVDRLERAALVVRRPDPSDRRVSRVVATPTGVELWWRVKEELQSHSNGIVNSHLNDDEQRQLLQLMGRLMQAFAQNDPMMTEWECHRAGEKAT